MNRIFTLLQKPSAELKKIINSSDGGALSVLMTGLTGLIVLVIVFLSIIDLSVYSYKKRLIASAIDYAVSAAVQEIDVERSKTGLSRAFFNDGQVNMTGIFLDEGKADKAFSSTIMKNVGIDIEGINGKMIRVIASPVGDGAYYSIKDKNSLVTGNSESMEKIEDILNARMESLGHGEDSHTVYVNGNSATNSFEKRPYYMVFIRDYQIDGLFSNRKATFICFKSARVYR